jgi:hypothetical protein
VTIHGSAAIANFQSYQIDYSADGVNWQLIAGPNTTPVYNDVLARWDTTNLPGGTYTLRLLATDRAGGQQMYFVTVTLNR